MLLFIKFNKIIVINYLNKNEFIYKIPKYTKMIDAKVYFLNTTFKYKLS